MLIGMLDSGVGGLYLAHALCAQNLSFDMIFFGDTQHMPYGEKSSSDIKRYTSKIVRWLYDQDCDAIVLGCNSMSAIAAQEIADHYKNIQVIDVITPTVEYIKSKHMNAKIGILATQSTINSQAYPQKLQLANPSLDIISIKAPQLAQAIENKDQLTIELLCHQYLAQAHDLDILLLACTHYPIIKATIRNMLPAKTEVLDSTDLVVEVIKTKLLLKTRKSDEKQNIQFYVSHLTKSFSQRAEMFFGEKVNLKQYRIWSDDEIMEPLDI